MYTVHVKRNEEVTLVIGDPTQWWPRTDIEDWCLDAIEGYYTCSSNLMLPYTVWQFEKESDATIFALRWA